MHYKLKNTLLLIPLLIITSCNRPKEPKVFEYIEFSRFNFWNKKSYSLKIQENGNMFYLHRLGYCEYYKKMLTTNEIDNISKKVIEILDIRFDSSYYSAGCEHFLTYCLIIKTKNKKFKTFFRGQLFSNKYRMVLDSFACHLDSISTNLHMKIDTNIVFESWTRDLVPLLPPPEILEQKVKFTAPIKIKEDTAIIEVKDSLNKNFDIYLDSIK